MVAAATHEVTQLPLACNAGDRAALDQLIPLVYVELHRMARQYLGKERVGNTLQTTAPVNELPAKSWLLRGLSEGPGNET